MKRLFVIAAALVACASDAPEDTAPPGTVDQLVVYSRAGAETRLELYVVLSTANAKGGMPLRKSVADAVRARARFVARPGSSTPRDFWTPVGVRAVVVGAADGWERSAADDPALAWTEPDATIAGGDAFAAAVARAIAAAPDGEASPGGIAASIERILSPSPDAERLVVVASTSDDASVSAIQDPIVHGEDFTVLVVPSAALGPCRPVELPALAGLVERNQGVVQTPCEGASLTVDMADAAVCFPRRIGACRVRALVPPGTSCDPARGWLDSTEAPPLDPALGGRVACEVAALDGDRIAQCADDRLDTTGPSGWCVPRRFVRCASAVRLVGAAAPPFATMEIACSLAP